MGEDILPCGHDRDQAAWLGCTEEQCRPGDVAISTAVEQDRLAREHKAEVERYLAEQRRRQ